VTLGPFLDSPPREGRAIGGAFPSDPSP